MVRTGWGLRKLRPFSRCFPSITSFHNSGSSDILLPEIGEVPGIDVQLMAMGTGQEFNAIKQTQSVFVRRGDDNGTYRKKLSIWNSTDLDALEFESDWYGATGFGIGITLNAASGMNAHVKIVLALKLENRLVCEKV